MLFTPAQIKRKSFESKLNFLKSLVLPWVDASHVYVGAWALGCFHSHISTQTIRRALTASVDSYAETKNLWRNRIWQSLAEGAGKRCSECAATSEFRWSAVGGTPAFLALDLYWSMFLALPASTMDLYTNP